MSKLALRLFPFCVLPPIPVARRVASPFSQPSANDCRHIEAARGFLGLGLLDDAWQELELVDATARAAAEVLTLRVELLLAKDKLGHARTIAAGAVRMHQEAGGCHYALALVEAQAGNLEAAKKSLGAAFQADPELRTKALDDPRLAVFWSTLGD